MQNTITARRVSYNWVALIVALVAIAAVVGFVAGRAVSAAAVSSSPTTERVQIERAQRLLQLNERFYPSAPAPSTGLEKYFQLNDGQVWQFEAVPSSSASAVPAQNHRLGELNERLYPSDVAAATVQSNRSQRLLELNEMLNPSTAATTAIRSQRDQRLWELNEKFYPSAREQSGCGLSLIEPDC